MRYMWMCNRTLSPTLVKEQLECSIKPAVTRVFTTNKRACRVFITTYATYHNALLSALTDGDSDSTYWSITSCNKQYVTDEVTGKYLGCLSEVGPEEALAWIKADDKNFSLRIPFSNDRRIWIPVMRNPNKMIPTGDAGYCRHCGNTNAQTPGNRYHPVYRPWPLHADA